MDKAFLRAYSRLLVKTCHRRGVHAMGGMAAQIPIKGDEAANEAALAKVRADTQREVGDGHDGTWVAHPGLVAIAREVFDAGMPGKNQIEVRRDDVDVTTEISCASPRARAPRRGLRHNVRVGVQYLESWLRGQGCVPIYHLMEDAATAEIARAQVWQQLHFRAALDDGSIVDKARFLTIVSEEMARIAKEVGDARFEAAASPRRAPSSRPCPPPTASKGPSPSRLRPAQGLSTTPTTRTPSRARAARTEEPCPMTTETTPKNETPSDRWNRRFEGIVRPYSQADVKRLRGSMHVKHTVAEDGARRLWDLMHELPYGARSPGTGWRRSWPAPRPASAGRSTPTSS